MFPRCKFAGDCRWKENSKKRGAQCCAVAFPGKWVETPDGRKYTHAGEDGKVRPALYRASSPAPLMTIGQLRLELARRYFNTRALNDIARVALRRPGRVKDTIRFKVREAARLCYGFCGPADIRVDTARGKVRAWLPHNSIWDKPDLEIALEALLALTLADCGINASKPQQTMLF